MSNNKYYNFSIKSFQLNGIYRFSKLIIISPKFLAINKTDDNLSLIESDNNNIFNLRAHSQM